MLELSEKGIALQLGRKGGFGWAKSLAESGWKARIFDETLGADDFSRSDIIYHAKKCVGFVKNGDRETSFSEVLAGLPGNAPIIAHIDIEGEEWDLLASCSDNAFTRFEQFYMEFHGFYALDNLERKLELLNKILKTHIPVHLHMHNGSRLRCFRGFLISDLLEVTFARRDLGVFRKSDAIYPTNLDAPNIAYLPEIYVGEFDLI